MDILASNKAMAGGGAGVTKFGAIPSEYDPRDYSVKMARAVTFPDEYEQPDVDIYDQGSIGNCVMQALRSCPHTHYGKEFGGTFGYGYWRDDGYQGEGMHPNVACNGFVRDGIPPTSGDKQLSLIRIDRIKPTIR